MYEIEISNETQSFLKSLEKAPQTKFNRAFDKVKLGIVKEDYFKKLSGTDGLWEFRVQDNKKWFRILAFLCRYEGDNFTTIVTTHGFEKKGNKTPPKEIEKAEKQKKTH